MYYALFDIVNSSYVSFFVTKISTQHELSFEFQYYSAGLSSQIPNDMILDFYTIYTKDRTLIELLRDFIIKDLPNNNKLTKNDFDIVENDINPYDIFLGYFSN